MNAQDEMSFGLKEPRGRKPAVNEPTQPQPKEIAKEKYFWVRFHERMRPDEPEVVTLGVNGVFLNVPRGKKVCIPKSYLEVARHTAITTQKYDEDAKRYRTIKIQRYTFDKDGEGTEADFLELIAKGKQKEREILDAARSEDENGEDDEI